MKIRVALSLCLTTLAVGCADSSTDREAGAPTGQPMGAGNKADDTNPAPSCESIDSDYRDCQDNAPADVSCEEYLQQEYPWGGDCCHLDGFDEVCQAYDDGTVDGSCEGIQSDYLQCQDEAPAEVSCEEYVQQEYPWGGDCCRLDGFDELCQAYG